MNGSDPRIDTFLCALKEKGNSSPAGIHWQKFQEFLLTKRQPGQRNPPVPLILAASGESDTSKYHRLSSQLEWALANNCFNDAIRYLEQIPVEQWNSCPLDQWHQ